MSYRREFAFVGVDTHKQQHTVALCNCWQDVLLSLGVPNDPMAFPAALQKLKGACPPGLTLVFGIEGSGGYGYALATFLKSQGYRVKEVNAVLTDRQRAKAPHPDKSDPIDARAIAKVLIDQYEELPEAGSEEVAKALKELVQHRTVLVRNRTALRNRLHSLLYQQHPNYQDFFDDPFRKTALAFWERFPSPGHLKGFGAKRLARYLRKHGNPHTGEGKAEQLLKAADKTREVSYVQQQRDFLVRDLVAQLRSLDERINMLVERMEMLLSQTGQTLTTMDGVDTVSAAMVLANFDIHRITSAAKLARHAGVAPLDNSSGKTRRKKNSKHGCRDLNHALYLIAVNQVRRNPLAQAYVRKKISEGKSKMGALRCLMRRLCDVIFALLRDQTPYRKPTQLAA